MSMTVHVDIVGAEASIFSGQANMVFAPGVDGELGIAPRHTQLITKLKAGTVRVSLDGSEDQYFFVNGGILEVQPHAVTVLADTAMRGGDLNEAAAEEARKRAEDALADKKDDLDYAKAQSELLEAVAQLRTIQKMRKNAR
ncbi:MAG: F0F1 ATP synthase subunit epsilon [Gammaproteobacteria bacterium]